MRYSNLKGRFVSTVAVILCAGYCIMQFAVVAFTQEATTANIAPVTTPLLELISSGEHPLRTARYSLKLGEQFSSMIYVLATSEVSIKGSKPQHTNSGWIQIPLNFTITSTKEDGTANVVMIIDSPQLNQNQLDKDQSSNSLHMSRIKNSIASIANTTCSYTFHASGLTTNVLCSPKNSKINQQVLNLLGTTYGLLPQTPIGKNAEWSVTTKPNGSSQKTESIKTMFHVKDISESQIILEITTQQNIDNQQIELERAFLSSPQVGNLLNSSGTSQGELVMQYNKPIPDMALRSSLSQTWLLSDSKESTKQLANKTQREITAKMSIKTKVNTFTKGN